MTHLLHVSHGILPRSLHSSTLTVLISATLYMSATHQLRHLYMYSLLTSLYMWFTVASYNQYIGNGAALPIT